jgi:hypothetical protein
MPDPTPAQLREAAHDLVMAGYQPDHPAVRHLHAQANEHDHTVSLQQLGHITDLAEDSVTFAWPNGDRMTFRLDGATVVAYVAGGTGQRDAIELRPIAGNRLRLWVADVQDHS